MNKDRRASIMLTHKALAELKAKIEAALTSETLTNAEEYLTELGNDVEQDRDDEQEYYDNMPEGLQGGEKGELAQEAISYLEQAYEKLEEFKTLLETVNTDLLEEALDALNDAANI